MSEDINQEVKSQNSLLDGMVCVVLDLIRCDVISCHVL